MSLIRSWVKLLVAAGLASILFCSVFLRQGWTLESIKLGYPARSADFWPLFVAETKNFYKEYGLEVETTLVGGGAKVVQILIAGDINIASVSTIAAMTAYFKGSPIIMVSGLLANAPYQIYAAPEIKSIKDLKNKPVAITASTDPPGRAISAVFRGSGLDLKKDVQGIIIPGSFNRFAALKVRQVAAAVLAPPFTATAKREGFRKLADARDFLKEGQEDGIIVKREFLTKEPEKIRKFVSALIRAIEFIRSERKEAVEILGKYTKQGQEALEESYDVIVPALSEKINMKAIESVADYLKEEGIIKEIADLRGFVDLRFISAGR